MVKNFSLNTEMLFKLRDTIDGDNKIEVFKTKDGEKLNINLKKKGLTIGDITTIKGNIIDGFKKIEYKKGSEIIQEEGFFENGNLKYRRSLFLQYSNSKVEEELDRINSISFPVGVSYEYNIKGRAIKVENNEIYFPFSLAEVKDYLKKIDADFSTFHKRSKINRSVKNGIGIWYLSYFDTIQALDIDIALDGMTGEKLGEGKRKSFTGNINELLKDVEKKKQSDSTANINKIK